MNNYFCISIRLFKSKRKNAIMNLFDLRNFEEITDQKYIINKIVNSLSEINNQLAIWKIHNLIVSIHITKEIETAYKNANNEDYNHNIFLKVNTEKIQFYSYEELIRFIYENVMLCCNNCKLDLKTLFNDHSIRYYINQYYNELYKKLE